MNNKNEPSANRSPIDMKYIASRVSGQYKMIDVSRVLVALIKEQQGIMQSESTLSHVENLVLPKALNQHGVISIDAHGQNVLYAVIQCLNYIITQTIKFDTHSNSKVEASEPYGLFSSQVNILFVWLMTTNVDCVFLLNALVNQKAKSVQYCWLIYLRSKVIYAVLTNGSAGNKQRVFD